MCEHVILYGIDVVYVCKSVVVMLLDAPFLASKLVVCSLLKRHKGEGPLGKN